MKMFPARVVGSVTLYVVLIQGLVRADQLDLKERLQPHFLQLLEHTLNTERLARILNENNVMTVKELEECLAEPTSFYQNLELYKIAMKRNAKEELIDALEKTENFDILQLLQPSENQPNQSKTENVAASSLSHCINPGEGNHSATSSGKLQWRTPTADFRTLAITETKWPEKFSDQPIVVPIVATSSFKKVNYESLLLRAQGRDSEPEEPEDTSYGYSRFGNPTRDVLEHALAKLEGVKYAVTFASGMAAISGVLDCLNPGDGIVTMFNIYDETRHLLQLLHANHRIDAQFLSDCTVKSVTQAIRNNTKMVWLESPTNPMLELMDIEQISRAVHEINKDIVVVVDNTFLTFVLQRPIELGADIAVYSLSKHIGGHGDLIMGAVTTDLDDMYEKIQRNQISRGGIPSPFDCFLALRGIKTLPIRLAVQHDDSLQVAQFLEKHPFVEKVLHPGLKSHKDHKLALRQQFGHSGVLGFYIRGGLNESVAFLTAIKVVTSAMNFGCDSSLACLPSGISYKGQTDEERQAIGKTDNYIRLSVGLESAQVIIQDLDKALKIACGAITQQKNNSHSF